MIVFKKTASETINYSGEIYLAAKKQVIWNYSSKSLVA